MPIILPDQGGGGGGGGFSIGSSYLIANTLDVPGNASGTGVNSPLALVASAGADFSIDGIDPTLLDIATSCWATIMWSSDLSADAGTLTVWESFLAPVAVPLNNNLVPADGFLKGVAFTEAYMPLTMPPVELQAGQQIRLSNYAETSAGTWTSRGFPSGLQIVRVA